MTRGRDLTAWLENFAPRKYAESWDNVGLLAGDPQAEAQRVMTCLTVTPESCAEAVAEKVDLLVSHHPILFRPVQHLRADRSETELVWKLSRAGVAVYSPHTAFDNTQGGINDWLANALHLTDVAPLTPFKAESFFKVTVFCPHGDREPVLAAAFAAGAGRIGNYSECSFSARGEGTFHGGEGANPSVGQAGRRETVQEWRIELRVPEAKLREVLLAIRGSHSYEEPGIDVYPLHAESLEQGVGRVGRLPSVLSLTELAEKLAGPTGAGTIQCVGNMESRVQRVALVCGAGDSFIGQARAVGADVLVTGEARFHQALEARALGLALLAVGHHQSERPAVEMLANRLQAAFPGLRVWPSRLESDPLQYWSRKQQQERSINP